MSDSLWPYGPQPARLFCPWDFPVKNTGVDCDDLFQEIILTQGLNPRLLHLLHQVDFSPVCLAQGYHCPLPAISVYVLWSVMCLWSESKWSESCSVVSDSLWPMDCIVHGILQARILVQVAFPFSRRFSQPRDRTQVSRIAGRFYTRWATRVAQEYCSG